MPQPKIPILIFGCGYTGQRVAKSLLAKNFSVTVTTRDPASLQWIADSGGQVIPLELEDQRTLDHLRSRIVRDSVVLHSIPLISTSAGLRDPTPQLLEALDDRASRIVYLSTTGVYGATRDVDASTPSSPRSERERLRVAAEQAVARASPSHLILRPAAIYGPGRGVHVAMRAGTFQLSGEGENYVSRIHVDDLTALSEASLLSKLTGAYPAADDEPCTSREIAEFCARFLGVPMPGQCAPSNLGETRRADRRVDGSAIRRALGVDLRYPSYRTGIPASI